MKDDDEINIDDKVIKPNHQENLKELEEMEVESAIKYKTKIIKYTDEIESNKEPI